MVARKQASTLPTQLRWQDILLIALWFGLLVGLGEVFARGLQKFLFRAPIFLSEHIAWMAPLADVAIVLIAGLVLCAVALYRPKLITVTVSVFVFAFVGFVGPLLWYERLHPAAAVLLATGLAAQSARWIGAYADGFQRLVRRTVVWLVVVVVILGAAVQGHGVLLERSALAKLPPAASGAPNVLLIVLDTVRARSLSLYGYERPTTPQLERLAKKGVVFEQALSTSPWTLPSHASMFTGRYSYETAADWSKPLDTTYPTLAEVFGRNGYATGGFVANLLYCVRDTGLNRGFVRYEDYPVSVGMVARSSWLGRYITVRLRTLFGNHQNLIRKTAEEVNEDFLQWLSRSETRPFFAFLNYFDAHAPYLPPSPFNVKFADRQPRYWLEEHYNRYSAEEVRQLIAAYDGSIAYVDHEIGRLFDKLEKRGLLENTLVIVTSDHGEQFGEHGLFDHANSLYMPLLHVPLLVSFPARVPAGQRVREPVTLRDIPATVADLTELKGEDLFPGASLASHWKDGGGAGGLVTSPLLSEVSKGVRTPEWYPTSKGDMKSLVRGRYHFIKNGDAREELYNIQRDPLEQQNLAVSMTSLQALVGFRHSLQEILNRSKAQLAALLPAWQVEGKREDRDKKKPSAESRGELLVNRRKPGRSGR